MKVLVVGNGGREHAIAWKLLQSSQITQVLCVPGNGGTATMEKCKNIPLLVDDFEGIARAAFVNGVYLVVVGPENPLALGITDYLQKQNLLVFGPSQAGAMLEASKSWAKEIMLAAGIPTAKAETFTQAQAAKAYVSQEGAPIVVKADGLAAGKGVFVCSTVEEAHNAISSLFFEGYKKILIEECLVGEEVSVLALTDGLTVRTLLPAQDHKRIGEGDTGNNTGGMGAYAPAPLVNSALMAKIEAEILQPTVDVLRNKGIDYRGVLYAGLMITPNGEAKVLEYNCRFGDPETQAILPLLDTPLEQLMLACIERKLEDRPPIRWKPGVCVCVVTASKGYPEHYEKGKVITGIEQCQKAGGTVFHAGTKIKDNKDKQLISDGGRVLGVTTVGSNFETAIGQVYHAIDNIHFDGIYYRRDIGHRVHKRS